MIFHTSVEALRNNPNLPEMEIWYKSQLASFEKSFFVLSRGYKFVNYSYSEEQMITSPPNRSCVVQVNLTNYWQGGGGDLPLAVYYLCSEKYVDEDLEMH
jgi:hypothetical protein